jgi:hypothetical protein
MEINNKTQEEIRKRRAKRRNRTKERHKNK